MTPSDAPYKQRQREQELALRASRRVGRVDRAKLMTAARGAFALAQAGSTRAVRHLRSLRAAMTPAERATFSDETGFDLR